jgi:hypothetical protein
MSQVKETSPVPAANPKWMTILGWVLTVLVVGFLWVGAYFKVSVFLQLGDYEKWEAEFAKGGFKPETMFWIGVVEFSCALIYLFPRTAVLGGALLNGYLGGAVFVHVVQRQPLFAPIIFGVIMWLGIYLREPRLRAIMPWRF